jgi:Transposase
MPIMETMARKKPRPRRSFTPEFKAEVVALVRQPGNTVGGVARELKLTETAVRVRAVGWNLNGVAMAHRPLTEWGLHGSQGQSMGMLEACRV